VGYRFVAIQISDLPGAPLFLISKHLFLHDSALAAGTVSDYLSRAGLTCNIFRNARSDHPSVTLALIPSAPSRKRTARAERSRR
jgi:hypothetical protein